VLPIPVLDKMRFVHHVINEITTNPAKPHASRYNRYR